MKSLVAVLALSLSSAAAFATPITGQFSITGSSVTDDGTTLTFTPSTVKVGAKSTLSGDFLTLLNAKEAGSISSPIDYAAYVPGSASITFTDKKDSVTFLINSIVEMSSGTFGNFTGTGIISTDAAGYDATPAMLLFSTQGDGTVTFSATAITSPVPEPSSLALLGTGIVGAAGVIRRRVLGA